MIDKEKFRKEVEKLKSNLIYGACSSQIAMETMCKEEAYNEVLAILDTMQEEPVSEKKCMFTKDNYTDNDRKVLCADCDEKCEYSKKEEPVSESIDFEQELYKAFGQIKDFTLGIAIAKRFYDIGRKHNEPVSEELEEAIDTYLATYFGDEKEKQEWSFLKKMAIYFAEWQEAKDQQVLNEEGVVVLPGETFERMKRSLFELAEKEQQMMAKAKSGTVQKDNQVILDNGTYIDLDPSMQLKPSFVGLKEGDRIKVIIIKED